MKKIKHISDLGPRQLWKLRKEIVVNSYHLSDYDNSYGIDPKECYVFFMGYINWIERAIKEEVSIYNDKKFWHYFHKYDTYHELNEYAAAF